MSLFSFTAIASNGWVSSGGDNTPGNIGAAWFLGNKPVQYCIESSDDFSVDVDSLNLIIIDSVNTWIKYYNDHISFIMHKNVHPDFNFVYIGGCLGSEDIKFSFGTDTKEINKLKNAFYNPFGFSTLLDYDPTQGRGHGIIWIGDPAKLYPDADPIGLNGMILHELGHLFGNSHVPFTIMDEKIAEAITATGPRAGWPIGDPAITKMFTNIDGKNQLFFNYAATFQVDGFVPLDSNNPPILNDQKYILSQFFGRPTQGMIRANFENLGPWVNYVLHLKDDLGSVTIKIPGSSEGTGLTTKSELFKTFTIEPNNNYPQVSFEVSKAWTLYLSFTTPKNENMAMTINLYTDDYSPVQIRVFYQGRFIQLFKSGQPDRFGSNR